VISHNLWHYGDSAKQHWTYMEALEQWGLAIHELNGYIPKHGCQTIASYKQWNQWYILNFFIANNVKTRIFRVWIWGSQARLAVLEQYCTGSSSIITSLRKTTATSKHLKFFSWSSALKIIKLSDNEHTSITLVNNIFHYSMMRKKDWPKLF
jgi:hypothetical protein